MPYSIVFNAIIFSVILSFSNAVHASQSWEYLAKTYPLLGNDQALTDALNKLTDDQWELVNCTKEKARLTCIFKRPARGG